MGLNFVATFMFAGVAFVAVAFWVDNRLARRRTRRPEAGEIPLRDPADS